MRKRSADGETDSQEVIANRRKARVSGRFRQSLEAKPATTAPSVFAGMTGITPNPGLDYGAGASGRPAKNTFYLGAAPTSAAAGNFKFGSGASGEPAGGGSTGVATAGFSFLNKPPAAIPAATFSKPPVMPKASSPPVPVSASPDTAASTLDSARWVGGAFGEGKTAVQGARLNKRFLSWVSNHLAEGELFLDSGMREYAACAAEIRDRANHAEAGAVSSTAFLHPRGSAAAVPPTYTAQKLSEDSISKAAEASVSTATPSVTAPASAPATVVKSTPAFSFSAPSALPAAPSGQRFSFAVPSTPAPGSTSGALTSVAPPATSPSGGFKFDGGGLGAAGSSAGAFNGFKVPSGIAIPPPVAAGSSAADAEEDGMPKEDPSKLERAPGEENEEVVGTFRAKLFRFKMEDKTWGDMGVGMLRLMKHTTNDSRRLVLRNDMGKVLLNAAVYKGMSVTKAKNMIKFAANVGDGLTSFMVKVTADEIDDLHTRVVGLVPRS
ncbi:unnamed protein product [Ectocarpus sp. CCAP 1310/34]|nr:unnamed protein product [Ectocarpus sp. CCAP 1310/34]